VSALAVDEVRGVPGWRQEIAAGVGAGGRLAALFGTAHGDDVRLTAVVATDGSLELVDTTVHGRAGSYAALTPLVPAAFWYERALHDLFGIEPRGHPRLDPLLLPLDPGAPRPRPGSGKAPAVVAVHERPLPAHLAGTGIFTLPHGPVRSGVLESVEYLIETVGEDIPHLRVRPHAKHRGVEARFEQLDPATGVLLAERVEGVATVAHAMAYAHALEVLGGVEVPPAAELVRVVHAELERIANHLDVAMRLADAAALAVATARFGWHKEQILRLRSRLCGSRFGRGVVVPGGVGVGIRGPAAARAELDDLERAIAGDERAAMATASFLDRLRGTGPLSPELAARHGALGPIGRASGLSEDVRVSRPYGAYRHLTVEPATGVSDGDVQARLRVRWAELHESFRLARRALAALGEFDDAPAPKSLRAPVRVPDGRGVGWAEAPQGEVLYVVEVAGGRLRRVFPRSASFHNLPVFHNVFAGDIFTDFPFIEASFGLSIAGVAV
jgi:formate hydrogenlyase subunit 5